MSVLQILNELAATTSSNEKVFILQREKNNELLKKVFQAAYNPFITYGIKAIPDYVPCEDVYPGLNLGWSIEALDKLSTRQVTGNAGVEYLRSLLENLSEDSAIVLARIIDRDLRCGTTDTLAARVWPGLVPTHDVMLCDNDITRIKYPAIIQQKCDGARVHLYFDGGSVKAISRTGKEFQIHGALDGAGAEFMLRGETFDGELLVVKDGKVLERKLSNGILNKANKGTISKEEADMIVAVIWDIVDFGGTIPYSLRFNALGIKDLHGRFALVPWKIVNDEDDAMEFFQEQLTQGQEGAVLKNLDSKWVPKRSKDQCKLKEINTADLKVIGTFEGTGKYVGMLGGLVCETSDGLLNVRVGSGFSDEERTVPQEGWIGKIVEVLYNQKITSKSKDKASLFLPRISCVRFDKTVANTIGELA